LSFDELDRKSLEFDRRVAATPYTDIPCTSTDWIIPAQQAFAPAAEARVLETDDGWVALMSMPLDRITSAVVPLEAVWMFASPFVGAEPGRLVEQLHEAREKLVLPRDLLVLSGVPLAGPIIPAILEKFGPGHRIERGPIVERRVGSMAGGLDGYLSRRTAKFRANTLRARRIAQARGVTVEYHSEPAPDVAALFARIVAVEERCWKGLEGTGMNAEPSLGFYRRMAERLGARGALRILFLRHEERDVAYVFGGLFDSPGGVIYRGQQASFDDEWEKVSLGSVAHLEMIASLADEGVAAYDLGSDLPYKRRWGEPSLVTTALYVYRR
jgi:hypothetical protein